MPGLFPSRNRPAKPSASPLGTFGERGIAAGTVSHDTAMIGDAVYEYWASPIGEKAKEAIRTKVGVEVVAFMRRGDRHPPAKKPINTPDLKLRVPEIPSWLKALTAAGVRPTLVG